VVEACLLKGRIEVQPLRTQAMRLAPEPPISRSDIAALAERFVEPLRGETPSPARRPATLTLVPKTGGLPGPQAGANTKPSPPKLPAAATAQVRPGFPRNALVSVVVVIALIPLAILFIHLWQDMLRWHAGYGVSQAERSTTASGQAAAGSAEPKQGASTLEVALSSPDRLEATAGGEIAFPIAIDATEALPARSIVAIAALPEGASFSQGRPYGATGWTLGPDEIGDLQLRLPAKSGASDIRLELVAGDGTVLSQSETRLNIALSPAETAPVAATDSDAAGQVASAEETGTVAPQFVADFPAPPLRKPSPAAAIEPAVKVNTVKVVTIPAPEPTAAPQPTPALRPTRPHDGAYALGEAADTPEAPAEWMVTKAPVDMHAKAQQSSETVKVAGKGLKVRVTARNKSWVQVTDPATSTTGWVYNRFLTPADPPAQ
jgi:hypothetical protein